MNLRIGLLALSLVLAGCARDPGPTSGHHAASATPTPTLTAKGAVPAFAPQHRFARLADRGELAAYPGRVVRQDGAYTSYRADISESYAQRAMGEGHLRITTPEGRLLDIRYDRHIEHPSGDWTWIGHLPGEPAAQTILTFGERAAFGSIAQPGGAPPLRLTVRDGVSWLVETDPRKVAAIINAETRPTKPDYHIPRGVVRTGAVHAAGAPIASTSAATASGVTTVDLLIGYTGGLVTQLGSVSAVNTRLNYLVDVANTAYTNSQVSAQVRLVHTMQVSYTDTNTNDIALGELSGKTSTGQPATPNPAFKALRAARETYGADLVSLVRPFRDPEQDSCGLAWLIGGGKQPVQPGQGWDEFGYSVIGDGSDQGSDGKTYYCRDETLAHEMGHNEGSAHDRATAQGDDGVLNDPDDYGAFQYSFGYKTSSTAGNFYTVMAYGDSGQTGYRVFSNPRITFCGGRACGTTTFEDNARSLGQIIPVVAGFRAAAAPMSSGAWRDINGDGKDDLFWSNRTLQQADWWFMNGAVGSYGGSKYVPSQYHVSARGDFDGDGRGDIIWDDGATIWLWRSEPAGGFSIAFIANHPGNGWVIAGAGDINGDGRSDLFWSNRTLQQADWWYMNGAAASYAGSKSVPSQYQVVGVADLNGDGLSDVVWQDSSTIWAWIAGSNNFSIQFIANQPGNGWAIAGLGDINGDGRSDLFWSNRTLQQADWWYMNGAAASYAGSKSVPSQYRVAMLGDFDGDGRSDVLWEDGSTVWIWHSEPAGGFSIQYVRDYPSGGWSIVR